MSTPNQSTGESKDDPPITTEELLGWIEFGCWTSLVLYPFLYYVNGPAVSTDQLVVRIALVMLSVLGALVLRIRKIVRRWRSRCPKT